MDSLAVKSVKRFTAHTLAGTMETSEYRYTFCVPAYLKNEFQKYENRYSNVTDHWGTYVDMYRLTTTVIMYTPQRSHEVQSVYRSSPCSALDHRQFCTDNVLRQQVTVWAVSYTHLRTVDMNYSETI